MAEFLAGLAIGIIIVSAAWDFFVARHMRRLESDLAALREELNL